MFCIHLSPTISSESAWALLESEGIEVLYGEEEEGFETLVIQSTLSSDALTGQFPFITACHRTALFEVDWEKEWEKHAPHFSDGKVRLDLSPYGTNCELLLAPGAGFGELSHPTTRLVLELMKGQILGKTVIDIGSGSGILALAAKALGAKRVIGIDIDREANRHAAENAALNALDVSFYHPDTMDVQLEDEAIVVLMNMITSEQQVAWKAFSKDRPIRGIALTSGVLSEQEEDYRKLAANWGWTINQIIEEDEWLGIHATIGSNRRVQS
ncbi:MAG: 50S ribosomal protein L11 methyltransferase [Verrucomicrobia bacterium]|nr:50S ribosomal protein L11 methyltransferase [Verrucomicrobiota bacterium]